MGGVERGGGDVTAIVLHEERYRGVHALVVRMDPPYLGFATVRASATTVCGEPETILFPCGPDGGVVDWLEMAGSRRGILDPRAVLRDLGYEVVEMGRREGAA